MNLDRLLLHWQLILFISFCSITAIRLFYLLFFFARLAFYRNKNEGTSQFNPISVIICARDEEKNLIENLPHILQQDYEGKHEVLVVDDNSWDNSKYLLQDFKTRHEQLKVVELTQEATVLPGKKFPLSIGIKSASHDIVLLTDADCRPSSDQWIKSMQAAYTPSTEIVLGYGAFDKRKTLLNKIIRWETFHSAVQYLSYSLAGVPYMGVGRNLSYKKEVFFRHKGFAAHNSIPGGDDDLFINVAANRFNTKINIDKNSFTFSKPAATWKQWGRQKNRHYTTGKFYKPLHKFLLGIYSLTQFLFYPLLAINCFFDYWNVTLLLFAGKLVIQEIIYYSCMHKLGEKDLFPSFLFDIWMFFYYIIFAPALFRKPNRTWK